MWFPFLSFDIHYSAVRQSAVRLSCFLLRFLMDSALEIKQRRSVGNLNQADAFLAKVHPPDAFNTQCKYHVLLPVDSVSTLRVMRGGYAVACTRWFAPCHFTPHAWGQLTCTCGDTLPLGRDCHSRHLASGRMSWPISYQVNWVQCSGSDMQAWIGVPGLTYGQPAPPPGDRRARRAVAPEAA